MNQAEMNFKAETGKCAYIPVEACLMVEHIDGVLLTGMTAKEIIDMLKFEKGCQAIALDSVPEFYTSGPDCFYFPDPDYIDWLQNKVIELLKRVRTT